jgi:hypothetical protein
MDIGTLMKFQDNFLMRNLYQVFLFMAIIRVYVVMCKYVCVHVLKHMQTSVSLR